MLSIITKFGKDGMKTVRLRNDCEILRNQLCSMFITLNAEYKYTDQQQPSFVQAQHSHQKLARSSEALLCKSMKTKSKMAAMAAILD